ncbi:MAG TPA: hypothetical protein VME41_16710 [Stellaceae bacterium]|nr:hypothetical protein [Stellaceae bacterium]
MTEHERRQAALDAHPVGRPFSFPPLERPMPENAVRPVAMAEVKPLLESWAFEAIRRRFPRAMAAGVRQILMSCTGARDTSMWLRRTDSAIGLFVVLRDCFEPSPTVVTKFLIHDDAPDEAKRIAEAAREWAATMKAVEFNGKRL